MSIWRSCRKGSIQLCTTWGRGRRSSASFGMKFATPTCILMHAEKKVKERNRNPPCPGEPKGLSSLEPSILTRSPALLQRVGRSVGREWRGGVGNRKKSPSCATFLRLYRADEGGHEGVKVGEGPPARPPATAPLLDPKALRHSAHSREAARVVQQHLG